MSTINLIPRDEFWANAEDFVQIKKALNRNQDTAIAVTQEELQEIVDQAAEKYGIRAAEQEYVILDADNEWWWFDRSQDQWFCAPVGEEEVVAVAEKGFYPGANYIKAEWGIISSPRYPEEDE